MYSKYLKSIADTSVIACDEIISVMDIVSTKKRNAIATNVTKTCYSKKIRDYYFVYSFILKIFKFLSQPFGYVGKTAWLDQVNFKIHDVTTWFAKITIHILPNISQNKEDQTKKFGQLIKYNKYFSSKIKQKMR